MVRGKANAIRGRWHPAVSWLLVLLVLQGLPDGGVRSLVYAQEKVPLSQESRFRSEINAFLRADSVSPPPKGAILFIGSSIFRQWTYLKEQMAPLPVFNRAFGGSRTAEVLHYMDTIVIPYEPKIVVYYCGSNDINAGEHAGAIAERVLEFYERLIEKLPESRMFFVSINRAPQKRNRWDIVDSTNALIRAFCSEVTRLTYVDVNVVLFDAKGEPRSDLYKEDQLHFRDQAYEEFTAVLKPVLERAWGQR
jgi:lysophospholipase L1-like esterase